MTTILVVEEEGSLRALYERDLARDGYRVLSARDVIDGLELLMTESPQLVVLDIRTPGMEGLETMVRLLGRIPRVAIVLNSRYSLLRDNSLSLAADGCVIKSRDTSDLRATVRKVLASRDGVVAERVSQGRFA